MTLAIKVVRDEGDKQGKDIVDALLSDLGVALSRGRAELDENGRPYQEVDLEIIYTAGVENGMLIEVQDSLQGITWRGKITGIRHIAVGGVSSTELKIRRYL